MSIEVKKGELSGPDEKMNESFILKLFRSFAVSIVMILVASTPLFIYYQNRAVKEDLIKEGKMLAGLLAYNSRAGVFAENVDLLKDAVNGIMNQKNVAAVAIYTAEDGLLISAPQSAGLKDGDVRGKGTLLKPGEGRSFELIEREKTLSVIAPVVIETSSRPEEAIFFDEPVSGKHNSVIGYAKVTMSKDVLNRETQAIIVRSAFIALIFLCAGIVVTFLAVRRITSPLTKLTEAAKALGAGGSVEKVPVESRDEIGRLAMSFNTMYDNLKKREEEKKVLEEQLRHSQKMEAIGTLARGIAHDFNNILSTVQGSVFILEKKMDHKGEFRHYIWQMHNSLNRAKNLINGLITFSKIHKMSPCLIDLNAIINKLRPALSNIAGEDVELNIALSGDALTIFVDSIQMEQVLMNLCSNARDAMPDGGTFAIATQPVALSDEEALKKGVAPGSYALLTAADNGTGMDEETRERIFEPFFTTKEVGRGTGLGLSIVFGIIEQLGGHIDVHTARGVKTEFLIYIPLFEKNCQDQDNKWTQ